MKIFLTKPDRRHNQRANFITKYTYIVTYMMNSEMYFLRSYPNTYRGRKFLRQIKDLLPIPHHMRL